MSISVIIIGASGSLGKPILEEFIRQNSSFTRIAILAATPEKAEKFSAVKEKGVEVITGSFLDPRSFAGFTHVICAVGNSLMRLQPGIIDSAIAGGVTHFYPSEWGCDISQKELCHKRYFRDKQVTRTHLASKAKEHPNFKYTLILNAQFTEWACQPIFGFDNEKHEVKVYGSPKARFGVTSIPDIVHFTVSSLLLPFKATTPAGNGREIRVNGSSTTFEGLVAAVGEARGVNYTIQTLPLSEAAENEEKARLAGDEDGELMWSITGIPGSDYAIVNGAGQKFDNDLFDFKAETMEETFKRLFG